MQSSFFKKKTISGQEMTVLNGNSCNNNVVSKDIVCKFELCLNLQKAELTISHLMKYISEAWTQMIQDDVLQLEQHTYSSNWALSWLRYDILLGGH